MGKIPEKLKEGAKSHTIAKGHLYILWSMARLTSEIRFIVSSQKERLLDIIDESKSTEFTLLERFGENSETIATLDQLLEIAE